MMSTTAARLLLFSALIGALFLAGCTTRRGGRPRLDTGTMGDTGGDTGMTGDSSAFDSGRADTSTMDSGRRDTGGMDTSTSPDTGTPADTGTPPDTSTPTDTGLPPFGDGGICIPPILPCPGGDMCCDAGTGIGMCAPTCT